MRMLPLISPINLALGQAFINILKQANAGVIRFLNWQNGNFSNETAWSSSQAADLLHIRGP